MNSLIKTYGGFPTRDSNLSCSNPDLTVLEGATWLSAGRAAVYLTLGLLQPKKVFIPDFMQHSPSCSVVLDTIKTIGFVTKPYSIDYLSSNFKVPSDFTEDDLLMYVCNLYQNSSRIDQKLSESLGTNVFIDCTYDFFNPGYEKSFSYSSARKWFGIKDGAWFRPAQGFLFDIQWGENPHLSGSHLNRKNDGTKDLQAFRNNESQINSLPFSISPESFTTISSLDLTLILERRRGLFLNYHKQLGKGFNKLSLLVDRLTSAPFAYPVSSEKIIKNRAEVLKQLWEKNVFAVPNDMFSLPSILLPVDQALTLEDTNFIITTLKEVELNGD